MKVPDRWHTLQHHALGLHVSNQSVIDKNAVNIEQNVLPKVLESSRKLICISWHLRWSSTDLTDIFLESKLRLLSDGSYLMVWMALRLLCMPAQIIQTMTFTQIMDIWRPGTVLEILVYHSTRKLLEYHLILCLLCYDIPP